MVAKLSSASPDALWAELEALPEGVKGEIIHGTLYTQPRPLPRHQNVGTLIVTDLVGGYQRGRGGPGGWLILAEPGIRIAPKEEFSPDVAGWRKERLPRIPDKPITLVPDWICEVQSKGTRRYDVQTKRSFYAEIGVGWLWYIDPDTRSLVVSRLERGRWLEEGIWSGANKIHAPPFEAVELDLAEWWGDEDE
jgi:Uma2 family endonuclease